MKDLTNQELLEIYAQYLPYGVRFWSENAKKTFTLSGVETIANQVYVSSAENIEAWLLDDNETHKLLLRPISDLTKEIKHKGARFVPWRELSKLLNNGRFSDEYNIVEYNEYGSLRVSFGDHCGGYSLNFEAMPIIRKLHEWHFDTDNLIDRGLALNLNDFEKC